MVNNKRGLRVEFILDLFDIIGLGCHPLYEIDLILFFYLSNAGDEFLDLVDGEAVGSKNSFFYW